MPSPETYGFSPTATQVLDWLNEHRDGDLLEDAPRSSHIRDVIVAAMWADPLVDRDGNIIKETA